MSKKDYVVGVLSTDEIAELFSISRGRVWQIERAALKKIREAILADRVLCTLARDLCGDDAVDEALTN